MRADVKVGTVFPDYSLPDHTGRERSMSELQGDDPMVVVLAREAYSAKDQVQQEGLVQLWREMKPGVGYCRLSDPEVKAAWARGEKERFYPPEFGW